MAIHWHNVETHARRLNRCLRRLEKSMRKSKSIDQQVKCANAIAILTREIVSLSKLFLGIEEVLKKHEEYAKNN